MDTRTLTIDGMSCGHCVARVTKALGAVPGLVVEHVEVGSATIRLDPAETPISRIAEALDEVGFTLRAGDTRA